MKKLLSFVLCVCMVLSQFTFLAFAQDNGPEPTNVAPYATVEVSSTYNAYTPVSSINDSAVSSGSTKWSPSTAQKDPALTGVKPWFTLSFEDVQKVHEVILILALPYTEKCDVKFEALVDEAFVEIGKTSYQSSPNYSEISKAKEVKVKLTEAVETTQIKVTFSNYTDWDPPAVHECMVMATSEISSLLPSGDPIDTSNHVNIAPEAIPSVFSNYYD